MDLKKKERKNGVDRLNTYLSTTQVYIYEHPRIMFLFFTVRLGFRRDYGHKVPLFEWNHLRSGD